MKATAKPVWAYMTKHNAFLAEKTGQGKELTKMNDETA